MIAMVSVQVFKPLRILVDGHSDSLLGFEVALNGPLHSLDFNFGNPYFATLFTHSG